MALPGVKTILKDRFHALLRTDIPTGPRVVAIASRDTADGTNDIADYDPYFPRSELDVINTFGEGSQLHRAFLELVAGGAARLALVALPAGTIDADLTDTTADNPFDLAFNAAETALPDIIVPWGRGSHPTDYDATPGEEPVGFHADNAVAGANSLVRRVADKCKEITDRSNPCFAVMGIAPFIGTAENMTAADVATHLTLPGLIDPDAADLGDNGHFVSVVATEMRPAGYPDEFGYSNGAAMYAGYAAALDPWLATTGKNIFNVRRIRYNPSRVQAETMIGRGVVPVTLDFNRVPTWVDGLTFSKTGSDYARLSTLRIMFDTMQSVRQVAQRFIGQPASLHYRNAFETAITTALRGMSQVGAITDSDFVVTYIPQEQKAVVDLVITPVFEMRNIEISVSVQL